MNTTPMISIGIIIFGLPSAWCQEGPPPPELQGVWKVTPVAAFPGGTVRQSFIKITSEHYVTRIKAEEGDLNMLDQNGNRTFTEVFTNGVRYFESPTFMITVNPSTDPWHVDLTWTGEDGKTTVKKGLCEVKEDVLKIDTGQPNGERAPDLERRPSVVEATRLNIAPSSASGTPGPLQSASSSEPLFIERKAKSVSFTYHVSKSPELKAGEWPALLLFLSSANGPPLDAQIAQAKDLRPGVLGEARITASGSYFINQMGTRSDGLTGYRFSLYDTTGEKIVTDALLTIEVPLEDSEFTPDTLKRFPRLSAALVSFTTAGGNFVFQRFLGNVASFPIPGQP